MLKKKTLTALFLIWILWSQTVIPVSANVTVAAPSVILIESSTGQIIYEANASERRSPASITEGEPDG